MVSHSTAVLALAVASATILLMLAAPGADAGLTAQAAPPPRAAPLPGDPRRGAALYEARCGACHSLDANRIGPRHRGVFGRKAGAVADFAYSPALKKSGIVWTAGNLDRWLTAPPAMVKGTMMGLRLSSAQDRADIIAYLASPAVSGRAPGGR
jgi:cytochrome c